MKDFNKYFIVGTNSDAHHDTMNGTVTGELIRCKDCKYYPFGIRFCVDSYKHCKHMTEEGFCSWAVRKETS